MHPIHDLIQENLGCYLVINELITGRFEGLIYDETISSTDLFDESIYHIEGPTIEKVEDILYRHLKPYLLERELKFNYFKSLYIGLI